MKLVWRGVARSESRAILFYISERNVSAAQQLKDAIDACTTRLLQHPFMYRTGRIDGTREAIVHPNYVLVYRVMDDTVEIISILHARQQYP